MHLARAELIIAIEEVLARLPDYELLSDARPALHAGIHWGLEALPVRFTAGARAGEGISPSMPHASGPS
jgi:cytochrome P450